MGCHLPFLLLLKHTDKSLILWTLKDLCVNGLMGFKIWFYCEEMSFFMKREIHLKVEFDFIQRRNIFLNRKHFFFAIGVCEWVRLLGMARFELYWL